MYIYYIRCSQTTSSVRYAHWPAGLGCSEAITLFVSADRQDIAVNMCDFAVDWLDTARSSIYYSLMGVAIMAQIRKPVVF